MKPTLGLDHVREVGTFFAMPASGPEVPEDETLLSLLKQDGGGEVSGAQLSKRQKIRMKRTAKRRAQRRKKKEEKSASTAWGSSE